MRVQSITKYTTLLTLALVIVFAAMSVIDATPALAHCDGLDGPVVGAARIALQTGDLNRVLIWVRPDDISEIRRAFNEALATRKLWGTRVVLILCPDACVARGHEARSFVQQG